LVESLNFFVRKIVNKTLIRYFYGVPNHRRVVRNLLRSGIERKGIFERSVRVSISLPIANCACTAWIDVDHPLPETLEHEEPIP